MRASGNQAATVDEPVLTVDVKGPWFFEDLLQQIYVIGSSCGQQPLICGCVVSGCVNARVVSSMRDVLLGAPSEAIFKEVEGEQMVWLRRVGETHEGLGLDDLDRLDKE